MAERFVPRTDPRPDDEAWPDMVWPVPEGTTLRGRFVRLAVADPDADAAELYEALDDDRDWAYVRGRPNSVEETYAQIETLRANPRWHQWVVRAEVDLPGVRRGGVVGRSSYLSVEPTEATIEIGSTAYRPSVWSTAVNPEVKLLLLEYAFERLSVGRVQLKTDIRNVRSQQAIARLGAQYEGVLRRFQRRSDGTVRDTVLFSVIAEDWPLVRDNLTQRIDSAAAG
jgi:RimJ/RimL family protein N-acetyltransferase